MNNTENAQQKFLTSLENEERELEEKLAALLDSKKLAKDPAWLAGYEAGYAAATAENKSDDKPKAKNKTSDKPLFHLTSGTGKDIAPLQEKLDLAISVIQKSKDPVSKSSMLEGIGFDKAKHRINVQKYEVFKQYLIKSKKVKIVGKGAASKFVKA
jgi:hypothetical protein